MRKKTITSVAVVSCLAPLLAGCSLFIGGEEGTNNTVTPGTANSANMETVQPDPGVVATGQKTPCSAGAEQDEEGLQVTDLDVLVPKKMQEAFSKEEYLAAICSTMYLQKYSSQNASTMVKQKHQLQDFETLRPFLTEGAWTNKLEPIVNKFTSSDQGKSATTGWSELNALSPVNVGTSDDNVFTEQITPEKTQTSIDNVQVGYTNDKKNIIVLVETNSDVPMYNNKTKKVDVYRMSRSNKYVVTRNPNNDPELPKYLVDDWSGTFTNDVKESKPLSSFK